MSILRALAVQIRIISLDQVARGWFPAATDAIAKAKAALCRLEHCGLICRRIVEAHPIVPLPRPMFTWKPTESDPSDDVLEEIAAKSNDRWSTTTPRSRSIMHQAKPLGCSEPLVMFVMRSTAKPHTISIFQRSFSATG